MTSEVRYKKFLESDEDIQELYDSYDKTVELYAIFTKYTPNTDQCMEIVGEVILGFHKISDLPRLFQQKLSFDSDQSQKITSELIEILSPVVRREQRESNSKKDSLTLLTETFSKPTHALENQNVQSDISDNVEPIRTMEGDVNRIHGYGAYYALKEKEAGSGEKTTDEDEKSLPS